ASATGMRFMIFSNQPVIPHTVMRAADTMKAPTASAMEKPPVSPAVASTAAPGVLHATITGMRKSSEGTSEHSPMPRPSAHIHEEICAAVAWKACAAWNTMATELVKPTSTATNPALKALRERSLKKRIGTGPWGYRRGLQPLRQPAARGVGSELDFRAQFHHRVVRQVEEVRSTTGGAMHLREQLFTPGRHAAADGGDHDIAREEVAGRHGIDIAAAASGLLQRARQVGVVLEAVMNDGLPAVVPQRLDLEPLVHADPRDFVAAHGHEQVLLMQHLIVLEVVQQRVRHHAGAGGQEHGSAGDARRRVHKHGLEKAGQVDGVSAHLGLEQCAALLPAHHQG